MRRDVRQPRPQRVAGEPKEDAITLDDFKAEVGRWARRLEVEPAEVHVTVMRRKWASCSPRGRVTFNTELLAQPETLRREAIVHELLHLKVPNHGPLFRALLSSYLENN
jgi:predicted metal-dependent hydrolase